MKSTAEGHRGGCFGALARPGVRREHNEESQAQREGFNRERQDG